MTTVMFLFEQGHKYTFRFEIFLSNNKLKSMSAFFVLVAVSILVAGGFLGAFIWSVKNDQYEDRKGAAMRILYDDEMQNNKI